MKPIEVYARLGWRLIPIHSVTDGVCSCGKPSCPSAGKHPRIDGWQDEATNNLEQLAAWSAEFPGSNLGVATGDGSGFFALDVDPKNSGDRTLEALIEKHGPLPVTAQASTPSGGSHYLFNTIPGQRNTAGKVGKGIDTRANGGQIVIAPSRTAKGQYRWVRAPWVTPIADAPEWLIEALRRAPVPESQGSSSERGFFPAASPKVLEGAALALERHGPALQGHGGDDHTYRAAALLTHDWALTFDEAWPLFCAWNETCEPPWSEADLRAKLHGGERYGSAAFGVRRTLDAVEIVRKHVTDWQNARTGEAGMWPMLEVVREVYRGAHDVTVRAVIGQDLMAATGLKLKALALPDDAAPVEIPEGTIAVTTRLHEVADESIKAITPKVFARNGVLCEVVKAERTFISDLETARIQDIMSSVSKFVRIDDQGAVPQQAPMTVAQVLHARRSHPGVRVLEAVTTAPVFLADGSILQTRGYNAQSRVFLEPSISVDVPDEPTQGDARAAVRLFWDLLCDFKFHEQADFSSWLAGLLTPLVKAATSNAPSPLVCVSASSPGAGKTLLVDVVARIVTGGEAEVRPYNPRDASEWGKRLTAFVKAAAPVSVFDNCNGPIGDEGLDRLITSAVWSDRILGASDAPPLPNVTTWWATGNNIEPIGDTVRRSLLCRLEVDTEKPQERTDFRIKEPLADYAQRNRGDLLSAALTILRAYHCAGRPSQGLPSWGSFGAWSEIVRGAIVWTGLADPYLTQRRASAMLNEPENEAHDFWLGVIDATDNRINSIVTMANQRQAADVLGLRDQVTAHSLKKFLGRFVDKPRSGRRIRYAGHAYRVEAI